MRLSIPAFIFVIALAAIMPLGGQARAQSFTHAETLGQTPLQIITLGGKTHEIKARFALTPKQQQRGLMWETDLPQGTGMIFPMTPPRIARFWMRNTLIPLDMLFIAPGGVIVKITTRRDTGSENVTSSGVPVSAVLELPAGEAARLKIGIGDMVRHKVMRF